MIVVVDSGIANIGSVLNMLRKLGAQAEASADPERIRKATRLILPGIGSFDAGVEALRKAGVAECLTELVRAQGLPCLGICLGMQLLCRRSEEGVLPGLGWLAADVKRFPARVDQSPLRVPHMGWNRIRIEKAHPLLSNLGDEPRFYFVHSYFVQCDDQDDLLATCEYGIRFACIVGHANFAAVQFHPEKSHRYGLQLMSNFVSWRP